MWVICFQVLATYITLPLATVTTHGNTTKKQAVHTFLFQPAFLTISPYTKRHAHTFFQANTVAARKKGCKNRHKVSEAPYTCLYIYFTVCSHLLACHLYSSSTCLESSCTTPTDIITTVTHFSTSCYCVNSMLL